MRVGWLLVTCAACNQVYGLDHTQVRDAREPFDDVDRDSVPDDRDNCPAAANAGQDDEDGDGRGDACDGCAFCAPCDRGVDHDEDRDQIDDACDNCPALANPAQANVDGDDLGDVCDPGPALHRRRFFDGFATLSPDWLQAGAPWTVANDDVGPTPGFGGGTFELRHATLKIQSGTAWFIELGLTAVPVETTGVYITTPTTNLSCLRQQYGSGWGVNNTGLVDQQAFPLAGLARLRFAVDGALGDQTVICEIVGVHSLALTNRFGLPYPGTITLNTNGKARFTYIDVIGP